MRRRYLQPVEFHQSKRHLSSFCRVVAFTLALTLGVAPLQTTLASSKGDESRSVKVSKKSVKHRLKRTGVDEGTGLDFATLELMNKGDWTAAATQLESQVAGQSAGSRDNAWLGFAYMYLGKCEELHKLADNAKTVFDARSSARLGSVPTVKKASVDSLNERQLILRAGSLNAAVEPAAGSAGAISLNALAAVEPTAGSAGAVSPNALAAVEPAAGSAGAVSVANAENGVSKTEVTEAKSSETSSSKSSSVESTDSTKKVESNDIQKTVQKAAVIEPTNQEQSQALLIQVYDEICAARLVDAQAELNLMPAWYRHEALSNFTFAALAGKQGRPADAVDYMQRTVGSAPNFAWGYRTLGKLQQNRFKDLAKAEAAYVSVLEVEPGQKEVTDALCDIRLTRNNFDGAIDVASAAIENDPNDAENYYRLALIYIQQWRLRDALSQLDKCVAIDPQTAKFYRSLATIKRYQGDINQAVADEQKAVDLSKDRQFELLELASLNQAAGNVNRAANNLEEAVKLDPNNQDAHEKLTALLQQEKRYDDLVVEFKRYIALKPKDVRAKMMLGLAFEKEGKEDLAVEQFKAAAGLDQNNPEPHREMGALRLKQKDFAGAAKEYTHALNINPSSVPDLVSLGYCYAQNDDYAQAEAALVTAIALQQLTQPNVLKSSNSHLDLMRSLAVLLMDEGRYSEASAQFEAIHAGSKGTPQEPLDAFRLSQAKSLRDLSTAEAQNVVDTYGKLSEQQRAEERPFLIETLLQAHKPELALPFITQAESDASGKDKTRYVLGKARALMLQGKLEDAKSLVSNLVPSEAEAASEQSQEYVSLSQIAAGDKNWTLADKLATTAIEKNPKNFNAFVQVGKISFKQNKTSEAIQFAKKAMEVNQYCTTAYLLLGDAQAAAGQVKDASANYRHAAELYPGLLEAHRSLLETLRKLSLKEEIKREEDQVAQMEKQQ